MFLSRSFWRRLVATAMAGGVFVLLYEASIVDSRNVIVPISGDKAPATAGARLRFTITAYCKGQVTASGVGVTAGIVAADPAVLPEGSVIEIEPGGVLGPAAGGIIPDEYKGIYTVLDTGPAVKGRHLDVYLWSCNEALTLGRRRAVVRVLRLGWNPKHTRER